MKIVLYGRIPSKKNSKVRTGKRLIPSKQYILWERLQIDYLNTLWIKELKLNKVKIDYHFYMPDARKTDLSNKIESINDMFVEHWLLEDDNWTVIKQFNCVCNWIDKINPRVEIGIDILS